MDQKPSPTNADLYEAGKQYLETKARLAAGHRKKATWPAVAAQVGVDLKAVLSAVKFAKAVDAISVNCGGDAKLHLLSDHRQLTAEKIRQIANTHPERQPFALARAKAGRDPLGKPTDGTDTPFDTKGVGEVLGRLPRNAGAIAAVADGLLSTPQADWPEADAVAAMLDLAHQVRRHVLQMKPVASRSPTAPAAGKGRRARAHPPRPRPRKPFDPKRALVMVAGAAGVTAKNTQQLTRTLAQTPPTAAQQAALLERLRVLDAAAARLIAVIHARDHDLAAGPSGVPGTYVVFFHLPDAAAGLRIGALGTFDFPAGLYAYLGSAFGPGGVRQRTHRHLTRRSDRPRWNIDHLKPLCTPVAVWWTHDRRKVEFPWAGLLASLPGADFPAGKFGAADNPHATAHLVRFDRMPSSNMFRRRVTDAIADHAPVYEKTIENWAGAGWPG